MKKNLLTYFEKNEKELIHKWMHYFEIYEHHFSRYRNKNVTVLEFGVFHGGSLRMWKDFFGKKALIYGVDINPVCKKFEDKQTKIFIGDQEDKTFLKKIAKKIGPIDVVIEDGSHTMGQQLATFDVIYPLINSNGCFLIEDLHTSYWRDYGGGYKKQGTFIEFAKDKIDQLNAWHSKDPESFYVDDFTRSTHSIHIYDSIIAFEKRSITQPHHKMTGKPSFTDSNIFDGERTGF